MNDIKAFYQGPAEGFYDQGTFDEQMQDLGFKSVFSGRGQLSLDSRTCEDVTMYFHETQGTMVKYSFWWSEQGGMPQVRVRAMGHQADELVDRVKRLARTYNSRQRVRTIRFREGGPLLHLMKKTK